MKKAAEKFSAEVTSGSTVVTAVGGVTFICSSILSILHGIYTGMQKRDPRIASSFRFIMTSTLDADNFWKNKSKEGYTFVGITEIEKEEQ